MVSSRFSIFVGQNTMSEQSPGSQGPTPELPRPSEPSVPAVSAIKSAPGLLRSSGVVGMMTLTSRVLGLVRDMVIARYFGAGAGADAFSWPSKFLIFASAVR